MMSLGGGLADRPLRAPREHARQLLEPSLDRAHQLARSNLESRQQIRYELQGKSWQALAEMARRDLLENARRYTEQDAGVTTLPSAEPSGLIFLTGHQPELFHPGVWFKNFVLAQLAGQCAGHGIHLLTDNDLLQTPALRVPAGSVQEPLLRYISYDRESVPMPHEERAVLDGAWFDSFGQRVRDALAGLMQHPLIGLLWQDAREALHRRPRLGEVLAEARRSLERRWGITNWESPLSTTCQGEAFQWFVAHLLARSPAFYHCHNEALSEYRRSNRVRSQTHPVPALVQESEWFETPFWIWSREEPRRRALFVRRRGAVIELSNRKQLRFSLPLAEDGEGSRAVEQLLSLTTNIRLRPRALLTTMFARLFLGDLFIHGIGGAKYDQLTDALIRRFFGCEPPAFLVATATAKLPIPREPFRSEDLREVQQHLRGLKYHPEAYLHASPETAGLVAAKRRWISSQPPRGQRRERHLHISRINEALRPFLAEQRHALLERRQELDHQARVERILGSREYSFVLFPEATLRNFLLDI